jgi:hypothetical protein
LKCFDEPNSAGGGTRAGSTKGTGHGQRTSNTLK